MSNRRRISLTISLAVFALTAMAVTENKTDDPLFTGDRRPGILEEPSDIPTGENAHLYDFLRDSLDETSMAEAPKSEKTEAVEEAPLKPKLLDEEP
jgi:hypothetical protein